MTRPVAIMFADMADSTGLFERLGDERAARLTQSVLARLREAGEAQRGRVVKLLGDGLLLIFPAAAFAHAAASAMLGVQAQCGVGLRVALHQGAIVEVSGEDLRRRPL